MEVFNEPRALDLQCTLIFTLGSLDFACLELEAFSVIVVVAAESGVHTLYTQRYQKCASDL